MLIVYRTSTGEVVDNTGTNSGMPEGPPDDRAYVNTDARGINRADLGLLRLHDVEDESLVQQILMQQHHVNVSTDPPTVVLDGPYPVETLESDKAEITADGTDAATVTYTNTHDDSPAEATFDVNGATATEPMVNGQAVLEITAAAPDIVTVTVGDLTTNIEAV